MRRPAVERSSAAGTRGYTLVELLLALTLGSMVLASVIGSLILHIRNVGGDEIREDVSRNTRYIGALLRHDLQLAGVGIESSVGFGTLSAWPGLKGDTLTILHLPYEPVLATPYVIDPAANGGAPPLAGAGTCGPRCIDLLADDSAPLELVVGDLARLQVQTIRRLIIVTDVTRTSPTQVRIQFADADTILGRPAGLGGGVQLLLNGSYVQKLESIVYYIDAENRLIRANRLSSDAEPVGDIAAYGVDDFQVSLVFADGDEAERADPDDADPTNDFDDVHAVRIRLTVSAARADPRVNGGNLLLKRSEWIIAPRNLRYEKNRI